ncbi:MAG: ribonuclease HII [Candidatus Diapherotrites archaeon]|nr:ribonuclease HII [Candidatus Diapherotrites archaeon]
MERIKRQLAVSVFMLVLGIDEAGRGPVLGPMVIAGVIDTDRSEVKFSEMGCRDSKELTPARREDLHDKIMRSAKEVRMIAITAGEIDALRKIMSLNEVEAKKIGELAAMFQNSPDKIIVDCPDTMTDMFVRRLRKYVGTDVEIVAEHKADVNYPIVSAASIIAKVERDRIIKRIEKKYGSIGSGYPADPITKKFLDEYFKEHGKLPPEARKSWETSKRLLEKKSQSTLGDY